MRRWLFALSLLLWGLAGPALAAITVRDDAGTTHRFDTPPRRIVSLLPSLTESVCALGACGRLVGVDRYANWPASVAALPHLGGLEDAQIERIAALKPDLVLASPAARVTDRLTALGLTVVLIEAQTHADVRRSLDLLARLLGTPAEGARAWAVVEAALRDAAARVPTALRGQRVYFEVSADPYAAGASSFIGETLTRLGLGNVVPAELGPFPRLNPEYVVRHQPDIVVAVRQAVDEMPTRPGWAALRALQARPPRACGFAPDTYDLLVRPGPRLGEGALALADCLARLARLAPAGAPR
jgi:iron complex transport system substrate-binding protein